MIATASKKPLILLVDDTPANLHVLASALREEYRIKAVTTGVAALEIALRPDRPDLILLDVMMPGMSGLEVLQRLRDLPESREIPIILVTADSSEQSQLDGLGKGADDYLIKPVVTAVLQVRVRNLLARKRSERQLRLAAHVFEYSGESILITDKNNKIIEVNPAFVRQTGYALHEVRGEDPHFLSSGRTSTEEYRTMWREIAKNGFWQGELWDRRKDGSIYPKLLTISVVRAASGEIEFHIGNFTDITLRKESEEQIRHMAHHDALTGLPNRLHVQIVLERAIATARREREEVAVMFIDLDRFKIINDTLGHSAGDALLVEVGGRIRSLLRDSDVVARLGGDEFVVVITGEPNFSGAGHLAKRIIAALARPYEVDGHRLHNTASIGIAIFPQDGENVETLMKCADTAMYHAKNEGRSRFHFYTENMNLTAREHLVMENSLHTALQRDEFVVHYQPQADLATGQLVGAEALIRWMHPERGLVSPVEFIPVAEESGLILPIGEWVLRRVCAQIREWREAGLPPIPVAVNLSARQFRQDNLAEHIGGILDEYGLQPAEIELEITESTAMEHADAAAAVLHTLHRAGFGIAIDDFGTGYSSLSYLKRFPVDKLKIDRSFIMDIPADSNDAAIAQAVIQMASGLGLKVIAEGVETEVQRNFLRERGCHFMQGFWYSKPLDAATFSEFLQNSFAAKPAIQAERWT
ncbi:MAG: EAL domain-containing protein [Desulfuromonadales bacterium]